MIKFDSIFLQRGSRFLLESASAVIHPGQKVALIGANGVGKSSLFRLLLGDFPLDGGDLSVPEKWRIAYMAQEIEASDRTALDYVLDGDLILRKLESAIEDAKEGSQDQRLASLYDQYDIAGGYQAKNRGEVLLQGLGFSQDDMNKPVSQFSGGWRIRLNLAQALMTPSDLLLLDEPTNHLDLDASLWLEDWLQRYDGTLLVISHDRDFIDQVCDQIIQIEAQKLWTYKGNYSAYERQRAERLARDQANYEKQQRRRQEIDGFVRRFKAKASKARQAQSRLKELERMEELAPAHVDSPFDFHFLQPDKFSDPLLNISQAELGYQPGDCVLQNVNLSIHPGSRIGLLGANGAGKSTFMRTLAGELSLQAGHISQGEHLKTGYFSQHQVDSLDLNATPMVHLQRITPAATEQELRNFLGGFDFRGDRVNESIHIFSGGEKARLALASIVWQKPNLLLLDEPTNHLDLEMCQALTMALQAFEGAMVLVSHDRHLVRNCVDQLYLVAEGRVEGFDGDLEDYSRWLLGVLNKAGKDKSEQPLSAEKPDRKQLRKQSADIRSKLAPLKKQVTGTESAIAKLEQSLAHLKDQMANPELYEPARKEDLQRLILKQSKLIQEKEELESQWYDQLEQLEALEAELVFS